MKANNLKRGATNPFSPLSAFSHKLTVVTKNVVVRLLLGAGLGLIGYSLGTAVNYGPSLQLPLIFGLTLGIVGIVLVRAIGEMFSKVTLSLAKLVASQVSTEMSKLLPEGFKQGVRRLSNNQSRIAPKNITNPLLIDTSAIIDGRIFEILQTDFLYGTIIVPNFILKELQAVSDSADSLKRAKGKRGLDILERIKKNRIIPVKIVSDEPTETTTDLKLLQLAKAMKGKIITTDFNLNKVAKIHGVRVLNVNELAEVVKTPVVPGENLKVRIVQMGKEKNQGVGYLPDGTMIVVEEGSGLVGQDVETKVSRLIQTQAGKMIFTEIKNKALAGQDSN